MFHRSHHSQGLGLFSKPANAFRASGWSLNQFDPDGLRYVTTISVRVHWLVAAVCLVELVYRPHYGALTYGSYMLLFLAPGFNGFLHHRLRSNRPITWPWLLSQFAMDLFLN